MGGIPVCSDRFQIFFPQFMMIPAHDNDRGDQTATHGNDTPYGISDKDSGAVRQQDDKPVNQPHHAVLLIPCVDIRQVFCFWGLFTRIKSDRFLAFEL